MGRFLWTWCLSFLLVLGIAAGARAGGAYELGEIRVCVRPPKVAEANLEMWAYTPGGETVIVTDAKAFRDKTRGRTVYIFDPTAPPENAKLLPIPHHKLACAPRVLPMKAPAPPAASAPPPSPPPPPPPPAGEGAKKDEARGGTGTPGGAPGQKEGAPDPQPQPITYPTPPPAEYHPGQPTHGPRPATVLPTARPTKKGDHGMLPLTHVLPFKGRSGKPGKSRGSGQGDGDGDGEGGDAPNKVAKKTLADKVAEELAYAGAIANQQFNEDTKRPDGKQYGIPGGKNAEGPNHPAAQAGAGLVLVVAGVMTAGDFKKKLTDALKKKTPVLLTEKTLTKEVAEEIAAKYGAHAADALNKNGAIGPYSLMKRFTDKLGARWQAHHILEKKMAEKFRLGNPEKMPSVILTEAEHKAITAKLKAETAGVKDAAELWKAYQKAYRDYPHWLEAIKSYFVKAK